MPRICNRCSVRRNGPFSVRNCTIESAVLRPMCGNFSSSSAVAVLILIAVGAATMVFVGIYSTRVEQAVIESENIAIKINQHRPRRPGSAGATHISPMRSVGICVINPASPRRGDALFPKMFFINDVPMGHIIRHTCCVRSLITTAIPTLRIGLICVVPPARIPTLRIGQPNRPRSVGATHHFHKYFSSYSTPAAPSISTYSSCAFFTR